MDDININVQNIEINILTNIPNNTTPTKLTKDIIYIPNVDQSLFSTFSSTPFITNNVEYIEGELMSMTYITIITTFFKRTSFEAYLKNKPRMQILDNDDDTEEAKAKRQAELDKILNNNVVIMLKALFPSVFPFTNNVDDSFSSLIQNIISPVNFSLAPRFSYLKINNNINTVTNVVWLNDILNHPEYLKFLQKVYAYLVWADNEKKEINKALTLYKNKFIKKFNEYNKRPIENEILEKTRQLESQREQGRGQNAAAFETKILSLKEIERLITTPIDENVMFNNIYYLIFNEDEKTFWYSEDENITSKYYLFGKRNGIGKYFLNNNEFDFSDEDATSVDEINMVATLKNTNILLYLGDQDQQLPARQGKDRYLNLYAMKVANNQGNLTNDQRESQNNFFICQIDGGDDNNFGLTIIRNFNTGLQADDYGRFIRSKNTTITPGSNPKLIIDKKEFFNRAIIFSDEINIEKKPADEKLKIFNKIDALIRSVNSYNNISQGYPLSESTFLNFIKEITDMFSLVKMSLNFNNKYLICDGKKKMSNIECIRLDVNDKTEWTDKYKVFKDTIAEYKNFMNEKTKITNTEFQRIIDNYGNNQSGDDIGKLNNFIIKTYEENIERRGTRLLLNVNNSNFKHIGVSNVNFGQPSLPSYQIYVSIDLLGGEINNENVGMIQCGYDDEELVSRWKNLIVTNESPWKKTPYPYVQLDELIKNSPPNPLTAVTNKIIPSSNTTDAKVGGKRSKRRKKNIYRRKTRKNKFISFY